MLQNNKLGTRMHAIRHRCARRAAPCPQLGSPPIVVLKSITQSVWYVQWCRSLEASLRRERLVRGLRLAIRQAQGPIA